MRHKIKPSVVLNVFYCSDSAEVSRVTFVKSGNWHKMGFMAQADMIGDIIDYLEEKQQKLLKAEEREL